MASDEELRAMGISNNGKMNNISNEHSNTVAKVIKIIAIITAIVGVVFGLYAIDGLNMDEGALIIIIASIISAVFIYALGEIIQKLENIDNNTRKQNTVIDNEIPKL